MGFLNDLVLSLTGWNTRRWSKPWDKNRPALYAFIQEGFKRDESTDDRPFSICDLPDDEAYFTGRLEEALGETQRNEKPLRFLAGAEDGACLFHFEISRNEELAHTIFVALKRALRDPSEHHVNRLYKLLIDNYVLEYVDEIVNLIVDHPSEIHFYRLRLLMEWFATQSPDRNAVKFALAVLGLLRGDIEPVLFVTLGRHEEFTLYAVTAITNGVRNAEQHVFNLARLTQGWGRIHAVRSLSETQNPEIKSWLLREGYKNMIMTAYTGLICAIAGDLKAELARAEPDESVMAAAATILQDLIEDRPGPDLPDYDDGAETSLLYLQHLNEREPELSHYETVHALKEFVDDEQKDWEELAGKGWTEDLREEMLTLCRSLLFGVQWKALYIEALKSEDRATFHQAARVAYLEGADIWESYFDRQERRIDDCWYWLMQTHEVWRVDRVLELAEEQFDLAALADGSKPHDRADEEVAWPSEMIFIIQGLQQFPGKGWNFVRAGLFSPNNGCKSMAINALETWGSDSWPPEAWKALRACEQAGPDSQIKERIRQLLNETK